MRGAVLLLALLATAWTAHGELMAVRQQDTSSVPGLHSETFFLVDNDPEARSLNGQPAVRGIARHYSGEGAQAIGALSALFGDSGRSEQASEARWNSWMDQQMGLLEGMHQSLLPAIAAPGQKWHSKAWTRQPVRAVDASQPFASPVLLQRMAYSRLPSTLLARLMADSADLDARPMTIVLDDEPLRVRQPQPKSAARSSDAMFGDFSNWGEQPYFEASSDALSSNALASGGAERHTAGSEPFFGRGATLGDDPRSFLSFENMADGRPLGTTSPEEPSFLGPDGQLNAGLLLFVLLCAACVAVWLRLALLCFAVRRATGKCSRRRRFKGAHAKRHSSKGADLEAPLLTPLGPEAPVTDSLAIYTDVVYPAPKGKHPTPPGFRPYEVQVAADHAELSGPHGNYVTIQYVPLQSESAAAKL